MDRAAITERSGEWEVLRSLLPKGWELAAKLTGAFQRRRQIRSEEDLLRMLLSHVSSDSGLRVSVARLALAGLPEISQVALRQRLIASGDWLTWICAELCGEFRQDCQVPGFRLRVVDSTTVQEPASDGVSWRLHYSLRLDNLGCDWSELTNAKGGERLSRTPMQPGDLIIADRNYFTHDGVRAASAAGACVLIRLRWSHPRLNNPDGKRFDVLARAKTVHVKTPRSWPVVVPGNGNSPEVPGRVLIVKLPAVVAKRNRRKNTRASQKRGHRADPRSLEAAGYVFLFSSVPPEQLTDKQLMELYQCRWQVELAFKRLKQLLQLGQVPHKSPAAARSWIMAKLLVALLLEKLYRQARAFSPWGYDAHTHLPD